ncbi:MAG: 1-acyl-sn-glycerol-3-phosphate acyltransferase, partial [Anaerolineaceae bacterium]|nr:1-acyl-sn-glycerol-3-phosphate acyltransferase [Anaerolineaceae bacterium]
MMPAQETYNPNRALRGVMQWMARRLFHLLSNFEVEGEENFPKSGPLIIVGNHFSFLDPPAFISVAPWPIEFIGGAFTPHAPTLVKWIPKIWGYLPVYRGTGSTFALKEAQRILNNGGIIGIFPEGGSWAKVLRPARPGAALLTASAGAPILPIGLHGFPQLFPSLRRFKRPTVRVKIGKPFGPFKISGSRYNQRKQLDKIGHEIMRHIAELIPVKKGGLYSSDPKIRESSKGTK